MINKKYFFLIGSLIMILFISLILYFNPLFSNKPLGLDTIGHLSKISYIKEFPFANWDMNWYAGSPFLKFYSPLFYYIGALFPNVFFGANLLCFLSITFTSIGIFFLVFHFSKKYNCALLSSLLFLTVLNTSYYFVSVGNLPFVFAIWTMPFSLLFLEKSFENRKFFVLFSLMLFLAIFSHIFIGLCVIFVSGLRLILFYGVSIRKILRGIKLAFIFLLPGIFLSAFWLVPFLTHSSSFVGDSIGYIPSIKHLFGFGNYIIWGKGAGEIGISFALFLIVFLIAAYKKIIFKEKYILSLLVSCIALFLLLKGILGGYYPSGIGAIRFILPFSIMITIFIGAIPSFLNVKKIFWIALFFLVFLGLFLNYKMINSNYGGYSYGGENSRAGFMNALVKNEKFPLKNEFDNFRFGTTRYIFSETLNFFLPKKSQTFGYYDQGMLYPEIIYLMRDKVWGSNDTNSTLYFLDWFGIKYFEIGGQDLKFKNKFDKSKTFENILSLHMGDYPFTIYEYKEATPIISVIKTNVKSFDSFGIKDIEEAAGLNLNTKKFIPIVSKRNISIQNNYSELNFGFERKNPDTLKVKIEKMEGGAVVLFKEFYHDSWAAKELPSNKQLEVFKTGTNFMLVIPEENAEEIVFYQRKTLPDYLGIVLTIAGLILICFISFRNAKTNPQGC